MALLDAVMALRVEPTEAVLKAEAEKIGLDWARMRRDMDDPAIAERLGANIALAQTLGVRGTPAIVIGDTLIPGAVGLAELQSAVAAARRRS
jgi:protein-disulfide isomerase